MGQGNSKHPSRLPTFSNSLTQFYGPIFIQMILRERKCEMLILEKIWSGFPCILIFFDNMLYSKQDWVSMQSFTCKDQNIVYPLWCWRMLNFQYREISLTFGHNVKVKRLKVPLCLYI